MRLDDFMKKNSIIKGTLILTVAGLITRIIGFFYKIYLSNTLGAEKLGLYQLIFPVYGICFTLFAGGIQTSISKLVADEQGKQNSYPNQELKTRYQIQRILRIGMALSFAVASTLSVLVYLNAGFLAKDVIKEASCEASLRILALAFPFCSISSSINGYCYGLKRPTVPASTQLLEQITRVVFVYYFAAIVGNGSNHISVELAVYGIVAGELVSMAYNVVSLLVMKKPFPNKKTAEGKVPVLKPLVTYMLPLTGNHLVVSLLSSLEAILIPAMLRKYGMSSSEALSIYGILIGMSIPFILFPSTITNSLAVLLLPTISEASSGKDQSTIHATAQTCLKYCMIIGIFSTGIFILFGQSLGEFFFHNVLAGRFLVILAWLCPFMYIATTLGSIINGLGKTHLTFINNVTGLGIRILFIMYMVPNKGIYGYLIGLLVSELAIAVLNFMSLRNTVAITLDGMNWVVKPSLIMFLTGALIYRIYLYILSLKVMPDMMTLAVFCCITLAIYVPFLFLSKSVTIEDFK